MPMSTDRTGSKPRPHLVPAAPRPPQPTAAEIAELHAAVVTMMVNGSGQSAATMRRMQARIASRTTAWDSGDGAHAAAQR